MFFATLAAAKLAIGVAAAAVASVVGYTRSSSFVRRRLRFIGAVQHSAFPLAAGFGAGLLALPVVAVVPFIGAGVAAAFGISVGAGVAAGARAIRAGRYLP